MVKSRYLRTKTLKIQVFNNRIDTNNSVCDNFGDMKSLIVEDDYSSQLLLLGILGQFGQPEIASDGPEALTLFEETLAAGSSFDVVCLDINMPVMNGFKTLEQLRELERNYGVDSGAAARIIMTSALDDEMRDGAQALYDGYLNKPIRKTALEALLHGLGAL